MNREQRIQNAEQTLRIIEEGHYSVDGQIIDISDAVQQSVDYSELFSPETYIEGFR